MGTAERVLDTGRVPVPEQFAYWQDAVGENFFPLRVERDGQGPFAGTLRAQAVGPLEVTEISSQAQRVQRTPSLIARRATNTVSLNYQLHGTGGHRQGGRSCELRPGDFAIVDNTRPLELSFDHDFQQISVAIPHALLTPRLAAPEDATAVRVRGDQGVGALASGALRTLAAVGGELDRVAARAAAEHVTGLIALALNRAGQSPAPPSRAALLQALFTETDARLGDPGLSPAHLAARVGISTRHLHRLFADRETTFGHWVLERRLERAHDELADPVWDHWSITAIAIRWGFRDPSYFARAFRARYGVTPRAHRRAPR